MTNQKGFIAPSSPELPIVKEIDSLLSLEEAGQLPTLHTTAYIAGLSFEELLGKSYPCLIPFILQALSKIQLH